MRQLPSLLAKQWRQWQFQAKKDGWRERGYSSNGHISAIGSVRRRRRGARDAELLRVHSLI